MSGYTSQKKVKLERQGAIIWQDPNLKEKATVQPEKSLQQELPLTERVLFLEQEVLAIWHHLAQEDSTETTSQTDEEDSQNSSS